MGKLILVAGLAIGFAFGLTSVAAWGPRLASPVASQLAAR